MEQMAATAEVVKNYTPEMAEFEIEKLLKTLEKKDERIEELEMEIEETEELKTIQ